MTAVAFLVNNKSAWGGMTRLHMVKCRMAAKASQPLDEFGDYESAVWWLNSTIGREGLSWTPCGICRPRPPRRGTAPAATAAYLVNDKSAYGVMSVIHETGCRAAALASGTLKRFPDFASASVWLRAHVGAEGSAWKPCGICQPRPPSVTKTPARVASASVSSEPPPTSTRLRSGGFPTTFTSAEIVEMVKSGMSIPDIQRLMAASSRFAAPASPKSGTTPPTTTVQAPDPSHATTASDTPPDPSDLSARENVPRLSREMAEIRQERDDALKRAEEAEARLSSRAEKDPNAEQVSNLTRDMAKLRQQRDAAIQRADGAELQINEIRLEGQALREEFEETKGASQNQTEETLAAFELVAEERDELRKSLATSEAALGAAEARANETVAEIANLRGRVDAGDDRAYAELAVLSVADTLVSEGLLRGSVGLRVLDDMQVAAPSNTTLLEYRAIVLSDNRSDAEALATFDKLGEPRTVPGRAAYVISAFRFGRPVSRDEWISDVNWQDEQAAPLLRAGLARTPVGRAVAVIRALHGVLTPTLLHELLIDQFERDPPDNELMLLLDFWEAADPAGAAQRICATANQRPLIGGAWLDEALGRITRRLPDDEEAPRIIATRLAGMDSVAAANRALEVASWLRGVLSARFRLDAASVILTGRESAHVRDLLVALLDGVPARLSDAGAAAESQRAEKLLRGLGQSGREADAPGADVNLVPVENAAAVLRAIEQKYPALVILPQAFESASRWGRPNLTKLTMTLEGLGSAAQRYLNDPALDGYKELEKVPCKLARNVSATALRRYRSDYVLTDGDGNEVRLGPHFTVGSGDNVCRIYLAVDKQQRRYIVGHVGNHLRDKST